MRRASAAPAAILAACCILAACSDADGPAGQAAAATAVCSIEKTADIPLSVERGHIVAAAAIEGKPVSMLVDTGSETTVVTPDAVEILRLQRDPHAITNITGAGGVISSHNAILQSFSIGGMEMLDLSYAVAPLPTLSLSGYQASGALGADWLRDYDVDLDLPHRRMALYTVRDCATSGPQWPGRHSTTPVALYGRGIIIVPVTLDAAPLKAVLDSGDDASTLSDAAAAAAGVDATSLAHDPAGRGTGIDGNIRLVHRHRFTLMSVAGITDTGPRLTVGRLHPPGGATMLLGLDWLQRHRVWISYAHSKLFIEDGG